MTKKLIGVVAVLLAISPFAAAQTPQWEVEARARIEQHRKGDFTVRVLDAAGAPRAGVPVNIAMTRHAFPFGTAVSAKRLAATEAGHPYREMIPKLFNRAVPENSMKWKAQENEDNVAQAGAMVQWLRERDLGIHGHVMIWDSLKWKAHPSDVREKLQSDDPDREPYIKRRTLEHIATVGARYRGQVEEWDVVNEPFSENDMTKILYPDVPNERVPLRVEWFRAARQADPNARLFINDFGILVGDQTKHKDAYDATIAYLLQEGAPLGGIGMQSHYTNGWQRRTPEQLMQTLDRYARFGVPLQITEFDMWGKGWGETPEATEQAQAAYFRTFLLTTFSHPSINGFTMWGFWDGSHWQNSAPLFRADWTPKPGYQVYTDLVFGEWWTKTAGTTDANGEVRFRGFFGDYEISAPLQDAQLVKPTPLRRNGDQVVLRLP